MVMRNDEGNFMAAKTSKFCGEVSVVEAESVGVREALSWIKELQMQDDEIVVESDSQLTVNAIQKQSINYLEVGEIVESCKQILHSLSRVSVVFIRKNANRVAHEARMKNTRLYPRYGTEDSHDFDPQLDFAMFLKEARNYEYKVNNTKVDQLPSLEDVKQSDEGLKSKKSWKNYFLFSWLRAAKKVNKPSLVETEPSEKSYSIPTLRRGHSGPIYGNGGRTGSNRLWRQNSGPLTSIFKRTEEQMPYICLDKLNSNLHGVESYGPVYLVT